MDVHLRDLRYAVAVADELTVTAAAERLYVAQPTVSRQLRVLERHLGFDLFVRHPGGVSLTPGGEVLIESARALLADWEMAVQQAAKASAPGVLRVGLQTAVGRGIIGDLTRGLDPSRWSVSVRVVSWDDPTAGLATNTSDIAILWHPAPPDAVPCLTLREEPRCVILRTDHPLAGRDAVTFADIESEPVIALPARAGEVRDYWIAAERRTRPASIAAAATTADETFEAVSAGIGLAIIAQGNADLYRRDDVAVVSVTDLEPARLLLCRASTPTAAAEAAISAARRARAAQPRAVAR